jgi:hypothetical protein
MDAGTAFVSSVHVLQVRAGSTAWFVTVHERPESTGVPKVFLRIARKSILFEQKT